MALKHAAFASACVLALCLTAPAAADDPDDDRRGGASATAADTGAMRRAPCPSGYLFNPDTEECEHTSLHDSSGTGPGPDEAEIMVGWQSRLQAGQSVGTMTEDSRREALIPNSAGRRHVPNTDGERESGADPDNDEDGDVDRDSDSDIDGDTNTGGGAPLSVTGDNCPQRVGADC